MSELEANANAAIEAAERFLKERNAWRDPPLRKIFSYHIPPSSRKKLNCADLASLLISMVKIGETQFDLGKTATQAQRELARADERN